MKNARPRFALLEDGRLHDYGTDRTIDATGTLKTPDGEWDLMMVRQLIQDEGTIETAFTPTELLDKRGELHQAKRKLTWANGELAKQAAPPAPAVDKVADANAAFDAGTPEATVDKVDQANKDFEESGKPT